MQLPFPVMHVYIMVGRGYFTLPLHWAQIGLSFNTPICFLNAVEKNNLAELHVHTVLYIELVTCDIINHG